MGAATHEPTLPATQRKSIALQWIFTEKSALYGSRDRRAVRPGQAALASQMTTGLPGRAVRLGKLAEQPGSSVAGLRITLKSHQVHINSLQY